MHCIGSGNRAPEKRTIHVTCFTSTCWSEIFTTVVKRYFSQFLFHNKTNVTVIVNFQFVWISWKNGSVVWRQVRRGKKNEAWWSCQKFFSGFAEEYKISISSGKQDKRMLTKRSNRCAHSIQIETTRNVYLGRNTAGEQAVRSDLTKSHVRKNLPIFFSTVANWAPCLFVHPPKHDTDQLRKKTHKAWTKKEDMKSIWSNLKRTVHTFLQISVLLWARTIILCNLPGSRLIIILHSLEEAQVVVQLGDVCDVSGFGDRRPLERHLQVRQRRVHVILRLRRAVQVRLRHSAL